MAGWGCDGRDQNEMNVIQLLMWTARELVGNVTADLTTLQRVRQEHSTSIKKTTTNKQTEKLPFQGRPLIQHYLCSIYPSVLRGCLFNMGLWEAPPQTLIMTNPVKQ